MVEENPFLLGMLAGTVLGIAITVAFCFPRVARAFGKLAAVVGMGIGAGLTTWGLMSSLSESDFEALQLGPVTFYSAAQTLGWGVGFLVAGITAIVLAFVGTRK